MAIAPKRELIIQSPFLYLQAAGSDFSDFTARGIHLRWQLRKLLGEYHLPKGNLAASGGAYPATIGFNQPNDFVHVYKAPYNFKCLIELDFSKNPNAVTETGTIRKWDYIGLLAKGTQTPSDVEVRFPDRVEYDRVMTTINPMVSALKFIIEYRGIIEIQVKNQLLFEVCFFGRSQEPSVVQAEAISVPDLTSTGERYIACRKKLYLRDINTIALPMAAKANQPGQSEQANCMLCENIEYVRYRRTSAPVTLVHLVTYQNTYEGYQRKQMWQPVNRFSLTLDKNEAFTRLDHPVSNETRVDKQWMKYNDLDLSTGMFTVSVPNYQDRWLPAQGSKGIRYAVEKYLDLSRTDLLATEMLPSETPGDDAVTELSYLNVLNILGVDYHVARMLGLGHLDLMEERHYQPYIYFAAYTTQVALGNGYPAKARTHIAMSLPTTQRDFRYPLRPELNPVTYGVVSQNGTQTPTPLTLPGGYTPDGLSRIINLFAQPSLFNHPMESFFRTDDEFCLCHASRTVLYGLDYKKDTEPIWRQPELLHDHFYNDPAGLPETVPIPVQEDDTLPVFIHREMEEGRHEYALYAINWFSRVSPLGNIVPTDVTVFSRAPLPPLNLMSQFIQEENPLIFTTGPEQQLLQTLPAADNSLARITFEWNQVHHDAYQFADFAELYIRKSEPVMVKGKITVVQNLSGNRALIHTGPYNLNSTNPVQTVQPFILPAQAASFAGGLLAAGQKLYQVLSVSVAGANPRFIVQQLLERTAFEDPAEPGSYIMNEAWTSPVVNEQFSITQNLSETTVWDAQLDKKVFLEKFFPLQVFGSNQAANNRLYTVQRVEHAGPHTEITVKEAIPAPAAATPGQFTFKKFIKYFHTIHSQQSIAIENNLLGEFSVGQQVELIAAGGNSGIYTISNVSYFNHYTNIRFAQPLPDVNAVSGVVRFSVTRSISAYNGPSRKFIINNTHLKKSLVPAYCEFVLIDEGQNVHEFVIGGIDDTATIVNLPEQITDPNTGIVTSLPSGVFEVTLNNFVLTPPADTDVFWYKGSARIMENAALFPTPGSLNYRSPVMKTLQVLSIDTSGSQTKFIVNDATFDPASTFANPLTDYMPIASGVAIRVNIHPGYRFYLTKANANISGSKPFRKADLLPAAGEGMRKSFIAIRAADLVQNKFSKLSPPSVLLVQEIVTPEPPGTPAGHLFATRPDVYGKATYTFDVVINTTGGRQPYSLVFYRADIRKILDTLYKPATVTQILQQLENLPAADKAFFNSRFHDLANTIYDNVAQQYRAYVPGGYRFPVPDNDAYVIPNPNPAIKQKPFNGIRTFGNSFMVTLYLHINGTPVTENRPMYEIIKDAVDGAFLALTEQPIIYKYLKNSRTTSNAKPKIKNSNGELIVPGNPINFSVFDPYPMAVQFVDGGQTKVRFTDYTLDGAAGTYYFYFGVELSNRLVVSDRSAVTGPISLVNSMPAEAPGIKRMVSTPQNLLAGLPVTVHFELNDFINSENIKKIRVYRANNKPDATTVRTMTLAAEIPVGAPLKDVFTGMAFPPYGEPLFYRLVALREIVNEQGQPEWVPSKPSEIVLTNIIDEANPAAPRLTYTSDPVVLPLTQLTNVSIQWPKTVHNGFYILYRLGETGNWIQVSEVTDNAAVMNVSLAAVLGSGTLIKQNGAGGTVFHHFKVVAVNSSGIKSREDRILTL